MSLLNRAISYYFSNPEVPPRPSYVNYTQEDVSALPPGTRVFRHPTLKTNQELMTSLIPGKHTLSECFEHAAEKFQDKECIGTRPLIKVHQEVIDGKQIDLPELGHVQWQTYAEIRRKIHALSNALVQWTGLGFGDRFGIYASTSYEWIVTAHACFRRGIVVATCYANLGTEALVHVINECEIVGMCVTPDLVPGLESIRDQIPTLKYLIVIGEETKSEYFDTRTFQQLIQEGQNLDIPVAQAPTKDDPVVIMYTSGSTGVPKGVVIRHINLISAAAGVASLINADPENDTYIAYLPLAHILELAIENGLLFMGVKMAYGNPRTLIDRGVKNCEGDIAEIRPTILVGVPRVFETIRKGAMEKIADAGAVRKYLFQTAYKYQSQYVKKNHTPSVFWNTLVFNKFQKMLGGRMRIIVSGGASLNDETHEFLKTAFNNCAVIQGYGLTETTGGGCVQDIATYVPGNVGYPVPSAEMRLVDAPELGYFHTDFPNPRGEVWIRGHNVATGYYKQDDKTRESFHEGGWFSTGDIGELLPDGSIKIIDRKKNLIKVSSGEYVALEGLEMVYGNSEFVSPNGVCVYADDAHDRPVALVAPNIPYVKRWARENHVSYDENNLGELIRSRELHDAVLKDLQFHARRANKKTFETVQDVHVCDEMWDPSNGLLTSAMKLNRQAINKHYKQQIDTMYGK